MCEAARKFKIKTIVEITGDCPVIDINIINQSLEIFEKNSVEYVNNCNYRSYPDGMDVQIFNAKSLKKTLRNTKDPKELEHVGLHLIKILINSRL